LEDSLSYERTKDKLKGIPEVAEAVMEVEDDGTGEGEAAN
jgi:hypothetical protein